MAFLDDRLWCHPKWVGLSAPAFRVGINAICYSHGFTTRGQLDAAQQRQLGATPRLRDELIERGIWEPDGDAIVIHDWDDYNDDSAREEQREKTRDRVRLHRSRRSRNALQGVTSGVTDDDSNGDRSVTDPVTEDVTDVVTKRVTSRARATDSENESEVPPLPPAERGESALQAGSRASGTNPRAIAEREQADAARERDERHDRLIEQLRLAIPQWARMDSLTFHELLDGIEVEQDVRLSDHDRDLLWDVVLDAQRST